MAKAPRQGTVKTRLAPSLSPEAVIDFYRCLLEDTLTLACSLSDVEVAIMCPESDVHELADLPSLDQGIGGPRESGRDSRKHRPDCTRW